MKAMTDIEHALTTILRAGVFVGLGGVFASASQYPVATTTGPEMTYSIAFDGVNYMVGVGGDQTAGHNVTAQLVSPSGALVGSRIAMLGTGGTPSVASSGANYLLVWEAEASSEGDDVYGQIVSTSGSRVGGPIPICTAFGPQGERGTRLAYGGSRYLVVWQDGRNGEDDWDIYARLVNQDGSLFGSELPLETSPSQQRDVAVAFDGARFLVVWQTRREGDPELWDVFGCFVSPSGAKAAPFRISQSTSASHNPLSLAFDGSNYLVVWNLDIGTGYPEPTVWDVYGRLVSPAGTFPTAEFAMIAAPGSQAFATVAFGNNHHLVCWNEGFGTPDCTVKARFFDTTGVPEGPEFTPFTAQGDLVPLIASPAYDGTRFAIAGTLGIMDARGGLIDGDVFLTFVLPPSGAVFDVSSSDFADLPFWRPVAGGDQVYVGFGDYAGASYTNLCAIETMLGVNCLKYTSLSSLPAVSPPKHHDIDWVARDVSGKVWVFKCVRDGVTLFEADSLETLRPLEDVSLEARLIYGDYSVGISLGNGDYLTTLTATDATLAEYPGYRFIEFREIEQSTGYYDLLYYHQTVGLVKKVVLANGASAQGWRLRGFGFAEPPCGANGLSLAQWTFNEGSGATASDSVGDHTAIVSGAAWEPSGFLSSGLRLSPETSVIVPGFQVLDGLRTLRIGFALFLDQIDVGGRMPIVSQITPSAETLPLVSVYASDSSDTAIRRSIGFALFRKGGAMSVSGTGVRLSAQQWYRVVCLYDGNNMDVTVNGVLAGRYTPVSAPMPILDTRDLVLGGFTGIIDDLEISTFDPIELPRPVIRLERADNKPTLHFTGILETATDARGPYEAVTDATSPYLAFSSGLRRFWRARGGAAAPGEPLATMLKTLPHNILLAIEYNQSMLEANPHLTEQLNSRIAMLQNPALADGIVRCRLYAEGGVTSRNGSRIPIVSVFPQDSMRADVIDSIRSLQLALPIIENFLETAYPAPVLRLSYGFMAGSRGASGVITTEDRFTYELTSPSDGLPFESILHHELAHAYYGHEALTQFLELYTYNLIHAASADAHSWIANRKWTPGSATNAHVHALLDIYDLIGPAAMAKAYQAIYPLEPQYGQPLSSECRQAFVDQAPAPLKPQVAAKADKI